MSHWKLIRRAIQEAETKHGRYLTLPELVKVHEEATSGPLTPLELGAVQHIWPGMQLSFNLERHSG